MEKIGIVTWFNYDNYGTVLQAYALQQKINSLGYESKIVNYLPKTRKTNIFDMNINYFQDKIKNSLFLKKYSKKLCNRSLLFENFRKNHLLLTDKCESHIDLKKTSDLFNKIVCGSDQIWNPNFFDKHFFLDFVDDNNKKISYSPSLGVDDIKDELLKKEIASYIDSFSCLSIREEKGKEILEKICSKKIEVLMDPTLLLTKDEWCNNLQLKTDTKPFILCYFLGNNKKYIQIAKNISKKYNLPIKVLPTSTLISKFKKEEILFDCGPKEFVDNINNASIILTDSFHGIIFSINFEKDFIALKRFKDGSKSQNSRVYNILKKFNLESRLYDGNINFSHIDYERVNNILLTERLKSVKYLVNSLEKSNKEKMKTISTNCTGCGLCSVVCPKKCIKIIRNKDGFYNYSIDNNKCINCNMCKKICAQNNNDAKEILLEQKMYSAIAKNEKIINTSSSGGVAYLIAKYAIEMNYTVIGCTYDNVNNIAKHIVIDSMDKISLLSGSKYLQSYTLNAFEKIQGIKKGVIFGTPCQIASIDNYLKLKNKRDDFILVDLICHGVPSYLLWDKLIKELNIKVDNIKFRNKKFRNKKVLTINDFVISNNKFYDFYDSGLVFNECCYDCNYREHTCADIRIGDYWGKKSKNGISKVIINSENGGEVFKAISKDLTSTEEDISKVYDHQQRKNVLLPSLRFHVLSSLKENNSLNIISRKYCKKIVLDSKIRKKFYKLYRLIKRK